MQAALIRGTLLGVKYMDKNNGGRGGCIVNMGSAGGNQTIKTCNPARIVVAENTSFLFSYTVAPKTLSSYIYSDV
jgi:hypothetical protein